ncbi:MAG: hypothetical protein RR797_00865 [Christensenella sp.]
MAIQPEKMIELYKMLPEKDQELAYELVKKLVLAWDPDFTKLTESEQKMLKEAKISDGTNAKDIDWDNIGA